MSRVALESLGCKLNQAEMEALADRLVSRGHAVTDSSEEADVYVLNTCSVTHIADRKSRQALRAARRANRQARVIATGCYARRAPGELGRLGVVDAIVDNTEMDGLVSAVEGDGRVRTTGGPAKAQAFGAAHGHWSRYKRGAAISVPSAWCLTLGERDAAGRRMILSRR